MLNRFVVMICFMISLVLLSSCGSDSGGGGGGGGATQTLNYKDMKSMVIDILKTEDAQKALQESSQQSATGSGIHTLSVQNQEQVRIAVKDVLVSPEYNKVIEKLMIDPRFAGEFAKAVNKQNKQIHKELMKDPSYQKDLIGVMKNPEMNKMFLEVLQGHQYRKQVISIMQESMQTPIIRMEILELLQKAVHNELKPPVQPSGGGKGGQGGGEGSSS